MTWQVLVCLGAAVLCLTIYLFATADSELAPSEDQGVVVAQIKGAPDATYQQMELYSQQMFDAASSLPEYYGVFQRMGGNTGFGGVLFQPWGERKRNATELQQILQERWGHIAGAQIAAFQLPALPGSSGLPLQFVITTTEPLQNLYEVTQNLVARARASGMFFFVDSDMKIDKPQATLNLDRELVGNMGLTQQDVGASLGAALGGGYVNYFSISGRSYKVIPQVLQKDRLNPSQVLDYYVHGGDGSLIQAGTVASITTSTVPESINHFQQLNAATISGQPGVSQATALKFLRTTLNEIAPSGYIADYCGPVAPVHARIGQLHGDVAVCPGHRVSGAGRAI